VSQGKGIGFFLNGRMAMGEKEGGSLRNNLSSQTNRNKKVSSSGMIPIYLAQERGI